MTYTSLFDGSDAYRLVPGENNLNVEVNNLRNFTEYNFTVSGYNIKGTGPCNWIVVKTEETGKSSEKSSKCVPSCYMQWYFK